MEEPLCRPCKGDIKELVIQWLVESLEIAVVSEKLVAEATDS
jgi:hypothetical protein